MAITLPVTIPSTATDALQPVDEFLMKGLDTNQKYIASQIEPGGGGIGGGSETIIGMINEFGIDKIDSVKIGGATNTGLITRNRFPVNPISISDNAKNGSTIDPEGNDLGKREFWYYPQQSQMTYTVDANAFRGSYIQITKGTSLFIQIKEGENWFSVHSYATAGYSDRLEFYIDGKTPTQLGLIDEAGNNCPDFISVASMVGYWSPIFFAFGLDGKTHILEIKNNDSAAKIVLIDCIDFGFVPKEYSITNKIKMDGGITFNGKEFPSGEYIFDDNTGSGHLGSVVLKPDGTTYALNGETCYTGKVKAGFVIDFPNSPTSLQTQGQVFFPDNGICLLTLHNGNHYFFSYTGKSETNINNASLTGIVWQTQYNKSYIASDWANDPSVAKPDRTYDAIINYFGTAPIIITNSNNKLDFNLKRNGVVTSYSITIPNGNYAADLVDIGEKISLLMKATSLIKGDFFVNYDSKNYLWSISVIDDFASELGLLFLSGPNSASSIASTLGFKNEDYLGFKNYLAENEKSHLSCRPWVRGSVLDYTSPRIKFPNASSQTAVTNSDLAKKESFTGLQLTVQGGASDSDAIGQITYSPPPESVGVEIYFMATFASNPLLTIQIEEHSSYKIVPYNANGGRIFSYIITFPKFTRYLKIIGMAPDFGYAPYGSGSGIYFFQFIKPLFSKPAFEKLNKDEKIIKTFEISPRIFWAHYLLGFSPWPYIPQGSSDPIKSFTTSGAWTSIVSSTYSYYSLFYTSTTGAYLEIKFDVLQDGGGISIICQGSVSSFGTIFLYLTNGATINESTDFFDVYCSLMMAAAGNNIKSITGLKAGTYILRGKKGLGDSGRLWRIHGISIIDKKLNLSDSVENVPLNYYSVPNPVQCVSIPFQKDDEYMTTTSEERSSNSPTNYQTKYGINYLSQLAFNFYSNSKIAPGYPYARGNERVATRVAQTNCFFYSLALCKEIGFFEQSTQSGVSTSLTSYVNKNSLQNFSGGLPWTKNGVVFSPSGWDSFFIKHKIGLSYSCSYDSGTTFNTSITAYFKIGNPVLLFDGTNYEQVYITAKVTNISFSTTEPIQIIKANVSLAHPYGFQNFQIKSNTGGNNSIPECHLIPLSITPSEYEQKFSPKPPETAKAFYKAIGTSATLSFPVFSDGIRGTPQNTIYQVTALSAAAVFYSINTDSGVNVSVTGGTIDLLLTSIR